MEDEDVGFKIPSVEFRDKRLEHWLRRIGISGKTVELVEIKTPEDMVTLKNSMRLRFPVLMATIIKILLYRKENKLACLLTSMYEISIDSEMFAAAIKYGKWEWLEYVWAFGKNWLGARRNAQNDHKILYDHLFEAVCSTSSDRKVHERHIKTICEWRLELDDDMLRALLKHYQEKLCLEFMGVYRVFIGPQLFLFALTNNNTEFMQGALLAGAFGKEVF